MKKIAASLLVLVMGAGAVRAQSYVPEYNNTKIKVKPVAPLAAYAFNLKDVRLLPGVFQHAAELNAAYLLELKPDRFLYRFYQNAGLPVKDSMYGGWESRGVAGHSLGHYLSGCALYYAASGDKRFKEKIDYTVRQLALCQLKRGNGYVGGIPGEDTIWAQVAAGDIRSQGFDLNGGWVPWYTEHKVLAGLLDAYLYADNEQAKTVAVKFADWVIALTNKLNDEQMQKMLACEHGGMNDALAMVYAITGNQKYLKVAGRFFHRQVLQPLSERDDQLSGRHANTQIPKIIGCAGIYELSGSEQHKTIADFFWQTITEHHSYVIGGNSNYEHLGDPGKLSDRLSDKTTETCNTYNMLKLTRHLFAWNSLAKYNDYYERALYSHILASQNPETGMTCYYVPLEMGGKKIYGAPFESFWCCTGTGMENHVKYGENIYARGKEGSLYVNLFIPSVLNWKEKGITVTQRTAYPENDTVTIDIAAKAATAFPLRVRYPGWAKQGATVWVNGVQQTITKDAMGYLTVKRTWKNKDRVRVVFPMNLYTEAMPDNPNRIALLYGPVVLAGVVHDKTKDNDELSPVLISNTQQLLQEVEAEKTQPLVFHTKGIAKPYDVELKPFYEVYNKPYNVYWDLFTPAQWSVKEAAYREAIAARKDLEARTVDLLRIGEMQPERDHNLQGERTNTGGLGDRKWRDATNGGWFSCELTVDPATTNILVVTYWGSDSGPRVFDILCDGQKVATQVLNNDKPQQFFEVSYTIPAALTNGKNKATVRFQAQPGKTAGGVFGVRMARI